MKLVDLIKAEKSVTDSGKWKFGDIDRAAWPMRKKKLRQSGDWEWRVVSLTTGQNRELRVLLRLNQGIEQFYAILGSVSENGIAVLCTHELHTSHGNWHCHATVRDVDDVFCGAWRDRDSLRRWPSYSGPTQVNFDVTRTNGLERAAKLYRFDVTIQPELFG